MPAPALRAASVVALVTLASSDDPGDRLDAGTALTAFLDVETAQAGLHDLVLDPAAEVRHGTSRALAHRADPAGWVVLVLALATADESQLSGIREGVGEGVGSDATRLQAAKTALRLQDHPDAAIAEGATRLLAILGAPAA